VIATLISPLDDVTRSGLSVTLADNTIQADWDDAGTSRNLVVRIDGSADVELT
jgi:hypothetical protein